MTGFLPSWGLFLCTGFHGAAADLNRANYAENKSAPPQTAEMCVVLQLKILVFEFHDFAAGNSITAVLVPLRLGPRELRLEKIIYKIDFFSNSSGYPLVCQKPLLPQRGLNPASSFMCHIKSVLNRKSK